MSDEFNFENEIQKANWDLLRLHYKRDALFILDPKLDLIKVGEALAKDDTAQVKIWIDNNELIRPTEKQVEQWAKDLNEDIANFLIVQPYVLMKLLN